jgi:phage shock protein A
MPDEPTSPATESDADPGYTDTGIPTFESVRDKIETRYETSIGAAELDADSPEGRDVQQQYEKRQQAAADRLAQIRKSMHHDTQPDTGET